MGGKTNPQGKRPSDLSKAQGRQLLKEDTIGASSGNYHEALGMVFC